MRIIVKQVGSKVKVVKVNVDAELSTKERVQVIGLVMLIVGGPLALALMQVLTGSIWFVLLMFLGLPMGILLFPIIKTSLEKAIARRKRTFTSSKSTFQYLLPPKRREEIVGDLSEIKSALKESGYSKFQIWRAMTFQKITILFFIKKAQVASWLAERFKVIN